MSCKKWEIRISKWHAGTLDKTGEAALSRHLDRCAGCRALEAQFRDVEQLLANTSDLPVPGSLSQNILRRVVAEMHDRTNETWFSLLCARFRFLRPALAVGLVAGGILMGVAAGSHLMAGVQSAQGAGRPDLISLAVESGASPDSSFAFLWRDK